MHCPGFFFFNINKLTLVVDRTTFKSVHKKKGARDERHIKGSDAQNNLQ